MLAHFDVSDEENAGDISRSQIEKVFAAIGSATPMLHLLQDLLVEFPGTTPESVEYKPLLQYIMMNLVSDGS